MSRTVDHPAAKVGTTNPHGLGERDALIDLWAARMVAAESTIAALRERLAWYQAAVPDSPPAERADRHGMALVKGRPS